MQTRSAVHQCTEAVALRDRATGVVKGMQPQAVQQHVLQPLSNVSGLLQQRM